MDTLEDLGPPPYRSGDSERVMRRIKPMSGIGNFLSAAESAITSGNLAAAGSAIANAQSAFGTSQTTVTEALTYIGDLKDAVKSTPADQEGYREALNALTAMEGQLPTVDAAQIQLLHDLGPNGDKSALMEAIAAINGSLATHSFF
jgi:hypothetical protein